MRGRNERIDLISNVTTTKTSSRGTSRPAPQREVHADPWASRGSRLSGIKFGSPSDNRAQTSNGTTSWSRLVSQAARGGLSSAFGGGGILGAIGGLGGLVSGIFSLFGSKKKTPPPLSLFRLPDAQAQTIYVNSQASSGQTHATIYRSASQQPSLQYNSAEIAQAVKHALLTSSSLNDVIAEL